MSAATWETDDLGSGGSGCVGYALAALAAVAVIVTVMMLIGPMLARQTVMYTSLGVAYTPHAEKHPEAETIRECLDQRGPYMILKHISDPVFYLVCQIDKATWGLQAVSEDGMEKTAFSPGSGSFSDLMAYLNKFAIKFRGVLPWMQ